jgi:hypothetical protein
MKLTRPQPWSIASPELLMMSVKAVQSAPLWSLILMVLSVPPLRCTNAESSRTGVVANYPAFVSFHQFYFQVEKNLLSSKILLLASDWADINTRFQP